VASPLPDDQCGLGGPAAAGACAVAWPSIAWAAFVRAVLAEYLSFIVVLFALYVVAGGIRVTGTLRGTPLANTGLLALGTAMASVVGTTGAAMILIRPLLRANAGRRHNLHVVVFFILLVANIGGALSPLGDPPLFVGFLRGIDFFWPARHLWMQTAVTAALVLGMFLLVDLWLARGDRPNARASDHRRDPIRVKGGINFVLIGLIIACLLLSAAWRPEIGFSIFGTWVALQNLVRDAALVLIAVLSLWLTPEEHRRANGFSWEPMREVAILFAGIFVTIIPVLAALEAGPRGLFAALLRVITHPDGTPNEAAYFWLTGGLSAFLDNAPTYLVFFELAGGDPQALMGPLAGTLAAISLGSRLHGRAHLCRERTEPHGVCDRDRERRQDAELLRLPVLGLAGAAADLRPAHPAADRADSEVVLTGRPDCRTLPAVTMEVRE